MSRHAIDIERLSRNERLELIEALWESISDSDRDNLPLTEAQRDELDRRLDFLDENGISGISPEDLRARIKGKAT